MHYNWSNELEEIKGDTSRFASPFESLNFFRRSVHRVSSNRCLVDGVPRENAIGIHPPRVLLHGGRDGNAKTPRSTSRRAIRRCSKFFETTLSTILETISFFFHEEEERIRSIGKIFCQYFITLSPRYKYCLHYFIANIIERDLSLVCSSTWKFFHRREVLEDPGFEFGKLES